MALYNLYIFMERSKDFFSLTVGVGQTKINRFPYLRFHNVAKKRGRNLN